MPKDNPELRDAVQAALKKVMEAGTYDQLLAKWNLEDQALRAHRSTRASDHHDAPDAVHPRGARRRADRPAPPPGRWVAVVVIALFAARLVVFVATSDELRWDLVGGYLFEESIMRGLWMTIKLTVVAMLVGIVLGTVLAVMRLSDNPVFRARGAAATSGSSAVRRSWCSCCSGSSSARCCPRSASASRSGRTSSAVRPTR